MNNQKTVKLTENGIRQIVKETMKRILKENAFDDAYNSADTEFQEIKELYQGREQELLDYMWFFIGGNKPQFIEYMKTSGNFPQ